MARRVRLVAPLTPYLGEELWNVLRGDGVVAQADWPEPESDAEAYNIERRVVERLRADVRDIFDVAGIDDADEITVAVAPDWKYRAYEIARTAAEGSALVGEIMSHEAMQEAGGAAQSYTEQLQDRQQQLEPVLAREEEATLLERAAWLLRDEFGADVTVQEASDDEQVRKAKPGKPAIYIE